MNITHKIKLDMQSNSKRQTMYVAQGDSMSRTAEITLYNGGTAWNVPETASILQIAYYKPDRTGGVYDTMPDNTAACTYSGNVVTARLHPQMFTVSGIVLCELRMANDDGMQLSTFSWFMFVAESATNKMTSEDYFNYASLNAMREDVGILKDLLTKDKTSLVAAINELAGHWGADMKKFSAALENFTDGDALGLLVYDPVADGDFVPMLIQRGEDEPEGEAVTVLSKGATKEAIAEEVGKRTTLAASDYAQGYFQRLTGIVESNVYVTTHTPQAVKRGEKVVVAPNGNTVTLSVLDSTDLSVAAYLGTPNTKATEGMTYIPENDGYLLVQINNPNGITPETNTSVIIIGESRIDVLEKEAQALREAVEQLPSIAKTVEEVSGDIGKRTTLTASDYTQGYFQRLQGIVASDFYVTTHSPREVKAGEKVQVMANGNEVILSVVDSADLSVASFLGTAMTKITVDMTYVVANDGWLLVQVKNNNRITPDTNTSVVVIGQTRIDALEKETKQLRETVETLPFTTLSASAKHRPFTNIVNNCQNVSDWIITNSSDDLVAEDTSEYIMWEQSLRCDGSMRCTKNTYDLTKNNLVFKIKFNSMSDGAGLYVRLGNTTDFTLAANYALMRESINTPFGEWLEIEIPCMSYSYASETLPDFSAINDITIRATEGNADWNLQFIGTRPKRLNNAVVSFTFDDGYITQFNAAKILAEKGITATLYHIENATGSDDYLTLEQLQQMVNYYGTDVEVHGDPPYDMWAEEELKEHWSKSQKFLKENGLGEGRHMAYPGGRHPANIVQLARGFFTSCRTNNNFVRFESCPPADNLRLRAIDGVGANGENTAQKVKEYIDKAIECGGWVILIFHKIEDGNSTLYCSESDLKEIADYAIASGAQIMNIAEVFDSALSRSSSAAGSGATHEQVQAAISAALGEVEAELEALL